MSSLEKAEIGGIELAYVQQGAGEPLVLVHGSLNDYRAWDGYLERFSATHRVIAYSRRCHFPNRCDNPGSYSIPQHAEDLARLVNRLTGGKAVILGHSYGASVALTMAARYPELVSRLVLAEPLMVLHDERGDMLQADRSAAEARVRAAFAADDTARAITEFGKWFDPSFSFASLPQAEQQRRLDNANSFRLQVRDQTGCQVLAKFELRALRFPVLLVEGDATKPYFRHSVQQVVGSVPGAKQALVADAGHGMIFEQPGEFGDRVTEFLNA